MPHHTQAGVIDDVKGQQETHIGILQMSEVVGQPGVDVVVFLLPESQHFMLVDGALHPKSKNPQIALNFLEIMRSPEALAIMTKAGADWSE